MIDRFTSSTKGSFECTKELTVKRGKQLSCIFSPSRRNNLQIKTVYSFTPFFRCPTDPSIFPALKVDPKDGKSLRATFKAFRFPLTGVVNFEVQIKFCPEKCPPVKCVSDAEFGRRKRANLADKNDYGEEPEKSVDVFKPSESQNNETETFLEIMEDRVNGTVDEFITADIQDFNYKLSVQSTTSAPLLPAPLELVGTQNETSYRANGDYRYVDRAGRSEPWSSNSYYEPSYSYGHNYVYGQSNNNHPIPSYNHPSSSSSSSYDGPWASSHPYPSIHSYGHGSGQNYPYSYAYPQSNNQRNTSSSGFLASNNNNNRNGQGWPVIGQPTANEFPRESQASPSTESLNIQPINKPWTSRDNGLGPTTSRPKSMTDRKKFRPPRPLARPKGMPVNDSDISGGQSVTGSTELPLSLAIVVGRRHLDDERRNIERIAKGKKKCMR